MPDIIRLRTSMETTSAIYSKRNSLRPRDNNILLLRRSNADRAVDVWLHCAGDEFDNRNDDRIPELPVCLCIRDLDPPAAAAASWEGGRAGRGGGRPDRSRGWADQ